MGGERDHAVMLVRGHIERFSFQGIPKRENGLSAGIVGRAAYRNRKTFKEFRFSVRKTGHDAASHGMGPNKLSGVTQNFFRLLSYRCLHADDIGDECFRTHTAFQMREHGLKDSKGHRNDDNIQRTPTRIGAITDALKKLGLLRLLNRFRVVVGSRIRTSGMKLRMASANEPQSAPVQQSQLASSF